ncbi:predicted protein [Arabidopsis lyrata subsp. lyrata]|uniref:Predicted protein n=1 Tax=Arabidopsis lyrata subsp. lyrata TaxID=81972 RepID=D7LDD7_ARALL|nr:predicted protein [Arabidopsis lyrata subsp. lyrata]
MKDAGSKQAINHQDPAKDHPKLAKGSGQGSTVNLFAKWRTHRSITQLPPVGATTHQPPSREKPDPIHRSPLTSRTHGPFLSCREGEPPKSLTTASPSDPSAGVEEQKLKLGGKGHTRADETAGKVRLSLRN